eukprot:5492437-Amphidinium_carterae.1
MGDDTGESQGGAEIQDDDLPDFDNDLDFGDDAGDEVCKAEVEPEGGGLVEVPVAASDEIEVLNEEFVKALKRAREGGVSTPDPKKTRSNTELEDRVSQVRSAVSSAPPLDSVSEFVRNEILKVERGAPRFLAPLPWEVGLAGVILSDAPIMDPFAAPWRPGSTTALHDLRQQTVPHQPPFSASRPATAPLGGVPRARFVGAAVPKLDDESRA